MSGKEIDEIPPVGISPDELVYVVVVNDEEQYSLWTADREMPPGWRAEGTRGTKEVCLEHIADVWTDMRPLSIRGDKDVANEKAE